MKTPRYALVTRMAAAATVALAGTSLAVPALADAGPSQPAVAVAPMPDSPASSGPPSATTPTSLESSPTVPAVSQAGLAEATLRDLGMTLEQFNAAGELARRAADAVPSLHGLPGFVGISLKDGKIVVQGTGAELGARIDELNAAGSTADFVLAPAAAVAPPKELSAAELIASSTDQLFEAYVREVGPAGLQAVAYANGHFVIRAGGTNASEGTSPQALNPLVLLAPTPPSTPSQVVPSQVPVPGKISAAEFVSRYKNVELEHGAPVKTEHDLFGGQGYVIPGNGWAGACSLGFSAFSPTGEPEFLTAGHCAGDGSTTDVPLEEPTSSPAAGGAPLGSPVIAAGALGSFGFSQFGGPGNTPITGTAANPGNVGTDIAIIKGLVLGMNTQPAATKWDVVGNPEPTSVKIIGELAPFPGQAVCRSGRTTGWKCGTVDSVGIWAMPGPTNDLRAVRAFDSTTVKSDGGDSGGPWISGNFAVGTHTGAETQGYGAGRVQLRAIAATLVDAMKQIPGVKLQLFLNKPELSGTPSESTVFSNTVVRGRVLAAPASAVATGSTVHLVRSSQGTVQETLDVPVDGTGNWSFRAPASEGSFQFKAETRNGFSNSGTVAFNLNVSELAAPAITAPAGGATVAALNRIEGKGTPGNVVKLSGDVTGSAAVQADGSWTVVLKEPQVYGKISVVAVQTARGHADSAPTTAEFVVVPPAPILTTTVDGVSFRQDSLPETLTGTGVDGAEVILAVDGQPIVVQKGGSGVGAKSVYASLVPFVAVTSGRWSAPFPAGLAVGSHTLAVSQSVEGVISSAVTARFSIRAPVAAASGPVSATPAAGALSRPASAVQAQAARAKNWPGPPLLVDTGADRVLPAAASPAAPVASPTAATASAAPAAPAVVAPPTIAARAQNQPDPLLPPSTGAGGVLPATALAAGALLLGGVLIAFRRRRSVN
ncbi:hypothetical protein [Arthrobacter sp. B3I4]|uniref:hypothetical protein n=1 Tax=Arthrobacter sp. B3I4 TaxID=3042267 RepID=UPI0027801DEB|nr:hypothetical protein [Arthrobacter sp. B3I4]MDQ0755298.1 hypothetical protein [Arthrobacter sp. B3I4]